MEICDFVWFKLLHTQQRVWQNNFHNSFTLVWVIVVYNYILDSHFLPLLVTGSVLFFHIVPLKLKYYNIIYQIRNEISTWISVNAYFVEWYLNMKRSYSTLTPMRASLHECLTQKWYGLIVKELSRTKTHVLRHE